MLAMGLGSGGPHPWWEGSLSLEGLVGGCVSCLSLAGFYRSHILKLPLEDYVILVTRVLLGIETVKKGPVGGGQARTWRWF